MSELIQYKCPCCGGAVEFNSTAQKMKCPYCDTEFEIETLKIRCSGRKMPEVSGEKKRPQR